MKTGHESCWKSTHQDKWHHSRRSAPRSCCPRCDSRSRCSRCCRRSRWTRPPGPCSCLREDTEPRHIGSWFRCTVAQCTAEDRHTRRRLWGVHWPPGGEDSKHLHVHTGWPHTCPGWSSHLPGWSSHNLKKYLTFIWQMVDNGWVSHFTQKLLHGRHGWTLV